MTVEKMMVQIGNLDKPFMVGYEPVHGTWTIQAARAAAPVLVMSGSVLKEVIREAHRDLHAT